MTYVADLSICTYFDDADADAIGLRAVGWLSWDHSFPVGVVSDSIVGRLEQFLKTPFSPWRFLGSHHCDLCMDAWMDDLSRAIQQAGFPETRIDLPPRQVRYAREGARNLLVPGERMVFVCPELILHYIVDHHYSPPDEFCHAVLRCPPIPSIPYFHRLIEAGGDACLQFIRATAAADLDGARRYMEWPADWTRIAKVAAKAVRRWQSPRGRRSS